MPLEVTPPALPPEYESFARAVGELAKQHHMRDFTLSMRADAPLGPRRFHGEVKAIYWTKDGRGRPSENLIIQVESTMEVDLIRNPESYG